MMLGPRSRVKKWLSRCTISSHCVQVREQTGLVSTVLRAL